MSLLRPSIDVEVYDAKNHVDELEFYKKKYSELDGEILIINFRWRNDETIETIGNFGIALSGNKNLNKMSVFVCGIQPDSIADMDNRIRIGDQLLEINDQVLHGRSHLNSGPIIRGEFISILKNVKTQIKFVILRNNDYITEMASYKSYANPTTQPAQVVKQKVTHSLSNRVNVKIRDSEEKLRVPLESSHSCCLLKGPSGFGFAITEGSYTNKEGIYVKHIVPEGSAAHEGTLRPGDRIVRVNRHDALNANYETVLNWIKTSRFELKLNISRWQFTEKLTSGESIDPDCRKKRLSAPMIFQKINTSINSCEGSKSKNNLPTPVETSQTGSGNLLSVPKFIVAQLRRASSPDFISISLFKGCDKREKSQVENDDFSMLNESVMDNHFDENLNISSLDRPIIDRGLTDIELRNDYNCESFGITYAIRSDGKTKELVVDEIFDHGLISKDGRICTGDCIVRFNDREFSKNNINEFITSMNAYWSSSNQANTILFRIYRDSRSFKSYNKEITYEISKRPCRPLGLALGKPKYRFYDPESGEIHATDGSVMIYEILKNGLAWVDGVFEIGDKILQVNSEDVRHLSQEEIAFRLLICDNKAKIKIGRSTNQKIYRSNDS